jgi:predicted house-cleaning noncanonical NTP pyrophosphatase (MazG superfamily)
MTYNPLDELDKATKARQTLAGLLTQVKDVLSTSEAAGLSLSAQINHLSANIELLKRGVFRILLLGEMKRGKSTILNALLGEDDILPTDVTPCTALLTTIKYGKSKKVTIRFKDGNEKVISFEQFKQDYTIDPKESAKLQEENTIAFPNVDEAVVEYDSDILKKGVEFIDSPGLNESIYRDPITLNHIKNCQAILFVLNAVEQFSDNEKEYLKSRLQGNGKEVFFLINRWDHILSNLGRKSKDTKCVAEAETKVHNLFREVISKYLTTEGKSLEIYEKRVFAISAINALDALMKKDNKGFESSGFSSFLKELIDFLNHDRLNAELSPAIFAVRQTQTKVDSAVREQLALLPRNIDELERIIAQVQPLLNHLGIIRDQLKSLIEKSKKNCVAQTTDSFDRYIENLANNFDGEFIPPRLKGASEKNRKEFLEQLENSFKRYFEGKISALLESINPYIQNVHDQILGNIYSSVLHYERIGDEITRHLIGAEKSSISGPSGNSSLSNRLNLSDISSPEMGKVGIGGSTAMGSLLSSFFIGVPIGGIIGGVIASMQLGAMAAPLVISGFGIPLAISLIIGGIWGARQAHEDYVNGAVYQLRTQIPKIAEEQRFYIEKSVSSSFATFFSVVQQMDSDLSSRRSRLSNLLERKRQEQINLEKEQKQLEHLQQMISNLSQEIESFYNLYKGA